MVMEYLAFRGVAQKLILGVQAELYNLSGHSVPPSTPECALAQVISYALQRAIAATSSQPTDYSSIEQEWEAASSIKGLIAGGEGGMPSILDNAKEEQMSMKLNEVPETGTETSSQEGQQQQQSLVRLRRGLSAHGNGVLRLWDLEEGKVQQALFGHTDAVHCCDADWQQDKAVSGSQDRALRVWDLKTRESRVLCVCDAPTMCLVADWTHEQVLIGCGDDSLEVRHLATGVVLQVLRRHTGPVLCVAADWGVMLSVSGSADGTLRLWDLATGEHLRRFTGHNSPVMCVAVDWKRQRALSGSHDASLRLWRLNSGECVDLFCGHGAAILCLSVDWVQEKALSGSSDKTLRLWDIDRGWCLRWFRHNGTVDSVYVHWEDMRAFSGSDDCCVRVWDLEEGVCVLELQSGPAGAQAVTAC